MREGERGEGRKERAREGERGEGGKEREREGERESSETYTHAHASAFTHTYNKQKCTHTVYTLCPYYYVLYTHPERDQCYNESRQSVPDASSGPGQ